MSDGMSDSRPYDKKHEKWDEIDGQKLKKPVDVFFWTYRDGVQAECFVLDIEFFVSRWGTFKVDTGDDVAIGFAGQDAEELAREGMKKLMKKRLADERFKKYLVEDGHL